MASIMNNDSKEQLDSSGTTLKVANLTFIEGILGQGAYGTVRLARRQRDTTSFHDSLPILSFNNEDVYNDRPHHHRPVSVGPLRPLRGQMERSNSAPAGDDFFTLADEEMTIYGKKPKHCYSSSKKSHRKHRAYSHDDAADDLADDEDLVAVKIFQKSILKRIRTMERNQQTRRMQVKTAWEKVEREIALMKKLSHPNLVEFYEVIDSPDSDLLYMVIEYMPRGEILTYQDDGTFRRKEPSKNQEPLEGLVDGHFDEFHAALYFVDILHGLAYLHQHHVIHRDLKPENVLLDARGIAKLSDFGVSHIFDDKMEQDRRPTAVGLTRQDTDNALAMKPMSNDGLITKTEGTWAFWSPEMCKGEKFSGYAADIWAAGCCLYIFVTGRLPFFSNIPMELLDMVKEAKVPYEGFGLSDNLLEVLHMTLERDPLKRAGVGDCLKHPYLLLARALRVQQLSVELAKSQSTRVVVEERDLQSAFRIVTAMPVVLLKSATKQIQEGFQAAKQRLSSGSIGRSNSFSDRNSDSSGNHRTPKPNSFGSGGYTSPCPPVNESAREIEGGEDYSSSLTTDELVTPRKVEQCARKNGGQDSSSSSDEGEHRLHLPNVFKLRSFGLSPHTSGEDSLLFSSVFRRKRDSDVSMKSDDSNNRMDPPRLPFFMRKRSDVSATSEENEDEAPRHRGIFGNFREDSDNEGAGGLHQRIRNSLSALKRHSSNVSSSGASTPKREDTEHSS